MSAASAIDCPNVGPIESDDDCTRPYLARSALSTLSTCGGLSDEVRICTTFLPSSGSLADWTVMLLKPWFSTVLRMSCTDAERCSDAVMRVPDSKSMPNFSPLPAIASAPISRIRPDIEKNHFDAPMKSRCQRSRVEDAPSADFELRIDVPRSDSRI